MPEWFSALGLTDASIEISSLFSLVLVIMVTVLCCLPDLFAELKETLIFPDVPGFIYCVWYSWMVHPQEPYAFEINESVLPVLLKSKTYDTLSPSFSSPKSWSLLSNSIIGYFLAPELESISTAISFLQEKQTNKRAAINTKFLFDFITSVITTILFRFCLIYFSFEIPWPNCLKFRW